ncbi:hypothetical protein [Flammeovirga sp. SubArs3]|uniref:hypothetical protein n=1 Tax=Flammeovirga sp. SubArs3 TaxID=2995316 RepID=UPI00248AB4DD|nr:hypothetical protein [Flammeovirga sp. SubArs3]
MKKSLIYIAALAAGLFSCDPYKELHNETQEDLKLQRENDAIPSSLVISEDDRVFATINEAHTDIPVQLSETYNANSYTDQRVIEVEYTLLTQSLAPKIYLQNEHYQITGNEYCLESEGWLPTEADAEEEITLTSDDYTFAGNRYPNFSESDYDEGDYKGYTYDSRLDAMISDILENHRSFDRTKTVDVIFEVYKAGTDTITYAADTLTGCTYQFLPTDNVESKITEILNTLNEDQAVASQIEVAYKVGEIGDISNEVNFFQKSEEAKWAVIATDALVHEYDTLQDADYTSFGLEYNSFSGATAYQNYLPQFLTLKFPYAQEGDNIRVSYDAYVSGSTDDYLAEYTFTAGMWNEVAPFEENTVTIDKFKYLHAETAWKVSLAEVITLTTADYAVTGDDKYGNFGYYDNVEGEYPEGTPVENIIDAKINHILTENYPDLMKDGQEVIVNYMYYDNGTNEVSRNYIYSGATETFERN